MTHPTLQLRALSTGYRQRRSVERRISEGLNLSIARGELTLLMGRNGSGKSTLMHTIAGLLPPIGGEVLIAGKELSRQSPRERARLLSLVLTERITSGQMTVRDVVRIGRYPHVGYLGRLSARDEAIVEDAIRQCALEGMQERSMAELSDGERQRTMIARALAQETPLILLDEPTAHLDLPTRLEVMQMLRRLAHERSASVLVSTHELDLALSWADTIWLLDGEGRLSAGAPEELVLGGAFERAFATEGLAYNAETGEFVAHRTPTARIALQAEGLPYVWTLRALRRIGYEVLTPEEAGTSLPLVRVTPHGTWSLLGEGGKPEEFASLSLLLARLRSALPSDQ